jgi:cellulose synthase/poly-beta-1,6-N-acetylglucosamine synthase-like glycosyltransferase
VAWTEVPASRAVLARQRERWHRGLIGTLWEHKVMFFNPRYGTIGMLAMPFYLFGELLAPVVEMLGWLGLALGLAFGAVNAEFAVLFLVVAVGYGTLLSVWAIVLEELSFKRYRRRRDFWRLIGLALIEGVGYRQMTVLFRLQAFWKYARGVESWGRMTREGFAKKPTS